MMKEYIQDLAMKLQFPYEMGVSSDLQAAFRDDNRLTEYELKIIKNPYIEYKLNVKLKNYNIDEASTIFFQVLRANTYAYSSFYVQEITENTIEYFWISATQENFGFYCHIVFRNGNVE